MKINTRSVIKSLKTGFKKHSPEILTGIGIAGMISTVILAVKATPKAVELIQIQKKESEKAELTAVETIKTAWKPYVPSAITGLVSILCIVYASSEHLKRNTALAAVYTFSETARKEYRDKVIDTIGEKKEETIRDSIVKEVINDNPKKDREVFVTGNDNHLCYDALSGRYFKSDIELINSAVNNLNRTMMSDMFVTLNEFYNEIGLSPIKVGDMLGWNIDKGLIEIRFSSQIADDGTPCLVIDYITEPRYDF